MSDIKRYDWSPSGMKILPDYMGEGDYVKSEDHDARLAELEAACKVLAEELSSARQHRVNQCSVARAFDSGHDWESAVKLAEAKQADNWKAWCAFKSATDANPTAARYLAAAREEIK